MDPAARDMFWRLLAELSRRDGVTIFVSTHFMNEAERCDRISLMHAGRVLAVGTPQEICAAKGGRTLEEAFIAYLQEADGDISTGSGAAAGRNAMKATQPATSGPARRRGGLRASFARTWAFARREVLEVLRDRVRLAFALAGPLILMVTFGYGISFDVENLPFAVFDRDQSAESRQLVESFAGSSYFSQQAALRSEAGIDQPAAGRRASHGDRHPARLRARPAQRPPTASRLLARRRQDVPRRDGTQLRPGNRALLRPGSCAPDLWQGVHAHAGADRSRGFATTRTSAACSPSRPAAS